MSRRVPPREAGYILVLVVIAAAILLIGSVTLGVLYGRNLNQQRELDTRRKLVKAFHGVFPGKERQQANMYSDFGYTPKVPASTPPTGYWDLSGLVVLANVATSNQGGAPTAFSGTFALGATQPAAWNGPYWTDGVDGANRPLDGWGRPLQLRYISTSTPPGWQVFSLGANGASETGDSAVPSGDDLVYPLPPYVVPTAPVLTGDITLTVRITNNSGSTSPATQVTVTDALQTQVSAKQAIPKNQVRSYTFTSKVKSGSITLTVANSHGSVSTSPTTSPYTLAASPTTFTLDLTIP